MANITTNNPDEGFYGAMREVGRAVGRNDLADKTWDMAMRVVFNETHGEIDEQPTWVREFLDGEYGQAFALNVVANFPKGIMPNNLDDSQLEQAVATTAEEWQASVMEPGDYRDFGVPEPMRYLDAAVFSSGYYSDEAMNGAVAG